MEDVYTIVTDRIIALLEQGTVPWQQPWDPEVGQPRNGASGYAYRGINIHLLSHTGYTSPFWYSFKQIKQRGGYVQRGEQSSLVTFWKMLDTRDEDSGDKRKVPLLRYYRVWNQEQADGIPVQTVDTATDRQHDRIADCEALVVGYPDAPAIRDHNQAAFYCPVEDTVYMPRLERFSTAEDYYGTLFHELLHSTGHKKRLDRPTLNEALRFGSTNFSKEELVAEMGAAYLCGYADIGNATVDQSASYIKHWLSRLKNDKHLVVHAASQAQRAVDHIRAREVAP